MTTCTANCCLILACGNPLRGDDGAALRLVEELEQTPLPCGIRILVQQQWTPELAEDIANATSVLFLDCTLTHLPGAVTLTPVTPSSAPTSMLTHHQEASALLATAQSIYRRIPTHSALLLIGAYSIQHGTSLSPAVEAALPEALEVAREWIHLHCP